MADPRHGPQHLCQALLPHKVNDDGAWLTLAVFICTDLAVAHLQLLQQRQRVMVIDEAHGFARD